jgi:hypothetical protein
MANTNNLIKLGTGSYRVGKTATTPTGKVVTGTALVRVVTTLNVAESVGNAGKWLSANAVADCLHGEYWKTDFNSKKDFAESMELSAGRVSQYVKAVELAKKYNLNTSDVRVSVDKVYKVASLKNSDEFLKAYTTDVFTLTQGELFKLVNDWKHDGEAIEVEAKEETEETEAKEAKEETEETEAKEAKEETEAVEVTDSNGNKYMIPVAILNQYKA